MATTKRYVYVGSDRVVAGPGNYVFILLEVSSQSAYLSGVAAGAEASDSISAYLYGAEEVTSSKLAFLHGNQVITSSQICYLEGYLPPTDQKSSISGFLVGDGEWPFIDDFTGLDENKWSTEKWITNVS